jgi:carboxylesterase type B
MLIHPGFENILTYIQGKIFQMNIATDRPDPLTALLASSKKLIPSSLSSDLQSLLKAYSLNESTPLPNLIDQATLLSGDLIFQQMIHETASTLSAAGKRIFYYHWDFPNPYSSPFFGGIAHHFVDCLFLFQTLHEIYPNDLVRRVAEDMARYWIGFAVGGRPEGWGEYPLEGVMVVDPLEGWVMRGREEDERSERRRWKRWEIIERLQPYAQTWGDQMANRRDGFWK